MARHTAEATNSAIGPALDPIFRITERRRAIYVERSKDLSEAIL